GAEGASRNETQDEAQLFVTVLVPQHRHPRPPLEPLPRHAPGLPHRDAGRGFRAAAEQRHPHVREGGQPLRQFQKRRLPPALDAVNRRAAFVVADGMPLVWAGWLPERVAGSDLLFELAGLAARRGNRVYFLGGADGVAAAAAAALTTRHPGLNVVGIENPH